MHALAVVRRWGTWSLPSNSTGEPHVQSSISPWSPMQAHDGIGRSQLASNQSQSKLLWMRRHSDLPYHAVHFEDYDEIAAIE